MIDTVIHGLATEPGRVAPKRCAKQRVFDLLGVAGEGDHSSRLVDRFILALIALNVVAVVLESVDSVNVVAGSAFYAFDLFSVAVFTIEYLARVWCCTVDPAFAAPIRGRLKFMASPMGLVDLAAILPFYLPMIGIDLRVARSARLVRLLRLAKLARYSSAFGRLVRIARHKKEEMVAMLTCVGFMLLIASSLMYAVEGHAQPDRFSSIPAAMWWGISTMTTVGYGDIYPITPLGKLLGACVSLIGMGLFALPAAILGSAFIEDIQRQKSNVCPSCGIERAAHESHSRAA